MIVYSFFSSRIKSSIARRSQRIQGGGRFVHQQDFRLNRECAGDAQALLLAAERLTAGASAGL